MEATGLLTATLAGCLLLTFLVFAPALHFTFVNYDDFEFVRDNPHVNSGLSVENVRWAFANPYVATGGPVTWLSHMLDVEVFGLRPAGHHATSIALHSFNTALVFLVLFSMTRTLGSSVFVAALFAVHPLHVESVAWISERKDVLSTFWALVTIAAYVSYTRRQNLFTYLCVLMFFAFALMSKPMVATLPFVLLLIDVWPLKRLAAGTLIVEKLPLLFEAGIAVALTWSAQQELGAVATIDAIPLRLRLSNAVISYVTYLAKTVWPAKLTVFYPYRDSIATGAVAAGALVLLVVTIMAVLMARKRPYITVGWFWYVGTLVPVIGLVQVGGHAMADRFTYVPLIGVFIIASWGLAELVGRGIVSKRLSLFLASCTIVASAVVTQQQLLYWANGISLWEHAIRVTPGNARAHANLGVALANEGNRERAITEYQEALRIQPGYAEAHNNLALALASRGDTAKAIVHLREAVRFNPRYANARMNLANLLDDEGKSDEAIWQYSELLRVAPRDVRARFNLAVSLARIGRINESIQELQVVLRIDSGNASARNMLDELNRR